MSKTDKSMEIMGEVLQTANIIGAEKTKQALIDARSSSKYLDKNIGNLIKKLLCKNFKISNVNLMFGTSKGKRTNALMIGYVLAKKHLNYKLSDLAILFKKDESNISKSITAFNRLQKENKEDKILIEVYERINIHITEFKNNTQWDNNVAVKH